MNLVDLLAIPRTISPQKAALSFVDGAESADFSYEELYARVDSFAAGLVDWGLQRGDRVAIFMGNRPEFVVSYFGVLRAGGIAIPINLRYRRIEIGHILTDSRPRLIITERQHLPVLEDAAYSESSVEATALAEELERWCVTDSGLRLPNVSGEDIASIIYTSGTTGASKGAMLSHSNILATVTALMAAWRWQPDDRLLLCLPLYHVHGLFVGLVTGLAAGATILLRSSYRNDETVGDLLNGRPSLFFAVPTIYVRLLDALRGIGDTDLAHMRLFCSGSAPLSAEVFTAFQELTGHTILERYGMTETGMNLSNPYAGVRRAGTVGTPLPGVEMRIVNQEGHRVHIGDEGEILIRGSNVFAGYWNALEKTADSFTVDQLGRSWFRTGDLARQDPESGYVTLLGRRHELIISGGLNIYPREIEELLESYPGIQEAAVVGLPHREWGEVPVAHLVCNAEIDDESVSAYCRQQLASFKVPAKLYRVPQLPRNAMGKVQKHLLKQ